MKIPLCNLQEQYIHIRTEVLSVIDELCMQSAFINGKYVADFEAAFIAQHNANAGVGCANGTVAIILALQAFDIGPGDEVILPAHTFVATAEAICIVGATPVFVDIKYTDYTIDSEKIEQAITKRTKAIIPVHIYGTPCDMDDIVSIADAHKLIVIEDAAQAHFAQYKGKYIGSFGDAATFSFYPGKNLGAYGDAGFVLCKSDTIRDKMRRLINHGRLGKFDHDILGANNRLDAMQAAILSIKLKYILEWTEARRQIAKIYNDNLSAAGLKVIECATDKYSVYHVYNVEVANREHIRKHLLDHDIHTGIHYPIPVHKMQPFLHYATHDLEVTEFVSERIMSLPIYPELQHKDVSYICARFLENAC
ncbi:MAG: hypothetical protein COC15_04100 [Legionellales bacterium]|nr:MAG: hypothetical protein COC15_04100 [Legionellales bacterium]